MKILLLSLNTHIRPHPVYPIGLDYVAAALSPRHEVRVVDLNVTGERTSLDAAITGFGPDLIGVSLRNIDNTLSRGHQNFLDGYCEVIRHVKMLTGVPVILGGSGYSLFPEELLTMLGADFGLVGDGEQMARFLDAYEQGFNVSTVPGTVVASKVIPKPTRWKGPFTRKLPTVPEAVSYYLKHGGILNIQTKRGCPFKCVYCTYPAVDGAGLRRGIPAEIGKQAKALQDAGARFLFITDSTFNADPAFSLQIGETFVEARLSIPWGAFFTPRKPPKDYYRRLAAAGLTHVEFGTDTLAAATLRSYQKPFGVADVFKAHEAALDAGLYIAHYFLPGGPGESRATLEQGLDHMERLEKAALFFNFGMRVYPGTPLFRLAVEEGQVPPDGDFLQATFYQTPSLSSDEVYEMVSCRAKGRPSWVVDLGSANRDRITSRMYRYGYSGPLWEKLIT